MDKSKYTDIAPYDSNSCDEAVKRISAHPEYLYAFVSVLIPGEGDEVANKRKMYVRCVLEKLQGVHSYEDFQEKITAGIFLPSILDATVTAFSTSGSEHIDKEKSYFYISNHRDIILDCALLDYALLVNTIPLCEMAIGDNLLANQFVTDLFKLNGGVVVKRTLPLREKYLESIRLSEYFIESVTEANRSIWCAQKSGRSKDGIDSTHPSIIKMLYLSKRRTGISFPSLIKSVRIVPVAISYQYDPNDINKGREEVSAKVNGKYEKKKLEDIISMVKGLRCFKGNVHVALGTPLEGEYQTPEEVAHAIDHQIHLNYHLWDTNYFAYDYLEGTDRFAKEYADFDSAAFLDKYSHLKADVRDFVLQSYANPVRSYLTACEEKD